MAHNLFEFPILTHKFKGLLCMENPVLKNSDKAHTWYGIFNKKAFRAKNSLSPQAQNKFLTSKVLIQFTKPNLKNILFFT